MKYGYVKMSLDEYNSLFREREHLFRRNSDLVDQVTALEQETKDMKSIINRLSKSHKKLLEFIEDNGLEFKEEKDE